MFNKIKYIDPKLYLPNGQPDLKMKLQPSDWKSLTPFIAGLNSFQLFSEDIKMPTPDGNTVLFIPMYGDDPFADQSPNGYSITNNGVIADSSVSAFGSLGAGSFSGLKSLYIDQNIVKELTVFTLEFDYYFNAIPNSNNEWNNGYYFFSNGESYGDPGAEMFFGNSAISINFSYYSQRVTINYNPDINKWHHFKITRDENNTVSVYIDNILIHTYSDNRAFYTGNYGFVIGKTEPCGEVGCSFNGYIANYHISNIVRSESYINWQPELIFHALLDKESKSVKTNQKLSVKGSITYDTVDDKQCAVFDGSSFIHSDTVKKVVGGLNKEVCYAAWFRTTDKTASQVIISCTETGGFNLGINPSNAVGYIRAELYANGSYCNMKDYSTDNLENNKWYFILANYNGSTFDLWLNDTKISSADKSGIIGYPSNNNVKFTIGSEANPETNADQCFKGNIADVRVYNRALTDEQIAQVYAGNLLNYSKGTSTLFDIKGKTVSDGYLDINYNFTHDIVYGISFINEFIKPNDKSNADGRTKENAVPWYNVVDSNNRVHVTDADGISKFYEIQLEAGVRYVFRRQNADYDDASWLWDQNGNELFYDDDDFWRQYTATYTGTYYIEVSHYGRHEGSGAGNTYLFFDGNQPTVPPELPSVEYLPIIQSTSDKLVFNENNFAYSFWIYKNANNDSLTGTVLELYDSTTNESQLKIYFNYNGYSNGFHAHHDGTFVDFILPQNLFNKRDLNSPFNIIINMHKPVIDIYIDGQYIGCCFLNPTKSALKYDIITIGNTYDNFDTFNGRIKWFRAYDRALTEDQIASLASQFDHTAGNGDTYINPLGIVPQVIDEDTAYVIRRYEDDTPTYFDIKECKVNSVGFFACPLDSESISQHLPQSISDCNWIGEPGTVKLMGLSSDVILNNSTISKFYMNQIQLIKNNVNESPMFRFTKSDSNSKFYFNKCRFSSKNCQIDNLDSFKINLNAGRYFLFTNTIGTFMMRNCIINHTQVYYDAFQILYCNKAIIRNVKIYTTTDTNTWNGFTFGFIRGTDQYRYDRYYDYINNSHVEYLDMKNITMTIRAKSGDNCRHMPGLLVTVSNARLRLDNIQIINEKDISAQPSSLANNNGLISIHTPYDYNIKNLNVRLPNSSLIGEHGLVSIRVTEPSKYSSYTQGKQMYHIIDGVNITMGNNSDVSQRNYWPNNEDTRYTSYYSPFSFIGGGSTHSMHFLKNCSIYAPKTTAIALHGVRADLNQIDGVIRLHNAHATVKTHNSIYGSNAIDIWYNGEINTETMTVQNYDNGNLINYKCASNNYSNTHVYIKNCNCPIQSLTYSKGNGGNNNAFIYCPNTTVKNGFFMRGQSNLMLPVDINRKLGHNVSIKLYMNSSQNTPFRFPPEPYKGLKANLTAGNKTMTMYFAHAELGKSYTNWINNNLYIEVETPDYIYDSRIDGKWLTDNSEWSVDSLNAFKYVLSFQLEKSEEVYVRLYYNVITNANGGLYWDPKIGWN